ncbi:SDR family NAD(P)-dependent oxidoreductase [Roseomonas populi]|uniref:SDR family oxidoreductase n=1 Tax=Roseomonas populi TaxID=3121582 RepID=A0ABT1XAN4_9PROT|nr:SDR family oxidoreductase [Roseomonas pecuniae]MCR0985170.1 SDR family oxidoreductase [Roseomonas pecuniae]
MGDVKDGAATRTAMVTGASTGLGRAIALALAREGFDLAVTDIEAGWLTELLSHPDLAGRRVVPVSLELRSEASIREAFARASGEVGPLGLLVNNAARALHRPAVEVSWDEWDEVLDVNLKGGFFLSAFLARACIAEARPGSVVNIASTHGLVGLAERSVYGISKGGIIQMTRMLAIEWAAQGIRVNAVAPATVMTPSRQQILADPRRREAMLARIPSGRFPTEEEVAAAVCYLASPGAASITGQVLVLDGGLTAA